MNNRRTGKIARMPKTVRDGVCVRLRDGATYPEIISWLGEQGFPGVLPENVSNWYEGGYCDWERDQERIEEMKARASLSLQMVQALKSETDGAAMHITEANELIVASQVNEVLSEFDVSKLRILLADKPANYAKLAKVVTSQSSERTKRQKVELEFAKYRDKVEAQKRAIEAELNKARDGGLAPETITKIEEALNLL